MAICSLCFTSCLSDLDNYESPNGGIKGQILDATTNEPIPLPVSGSTGVIINMFEQNTGCDTIRRLLCEDGRIVRKHETVQLRLQDRGQRPFVSTCEDFVTVKGQTTFNVTATPYARISASTQASGKTVTVTYKVTPTDPSFNVSDVYGYWNFAPGVDDSNANYAGKQSVNETEGTITFDLENDAAFQNNLYKIKANGYKVYFRIGAKTQGKINYSTISEVIVK